MKRIFLIATLIAAPMSAALANDVAGMVARSTEEKLGKQWVASALHLAKKESSFRCSATGPKTKGGRPLGVFQVMPGSAKALGYDPRRLHECQYGIDAGIAHMRACISSGVTTVEQMSRCHQAGAYSWRSRVRLAYK